MATITAHDDLQDILAKEACMIEAVESDSEVDEHENSHALRSQLTTQTNEFILTYWPFDNKSEQDSYLSKDLTGLACLCFPFALDDRIHLIARLFSVIYLLGEMIAGLDHDDAEECLRSLQEAVKGYWEADRSQPQIWMLCDLFDEIRSHEYALVDDIMEATWRYLGLRVMRRGRRTERQGGRAGFQDSFMAAGMLLPLHRFATGVMVDEDEFNYGSAELPDDELELCAAELKQIVAT